MLAIAYHAFFTKLIHRTLCIYLSYNYGYVPTYQHDVLICRNFIPGNTIHLYYNNNLINNTLMLNSCVCIPSVYTSICTLQIMH